MEQNDHWKSININDCELSTRTLTCLHRHGRRLTLGSLDEASDVEFLAIKYFGRKCLAEIRALIKSFKINPVPRASDILLGPPRDMIRVMRLIEYVGARADVEAVVQRSIHGTHVYGQVRITGVTIGEFAESLERHVFDTSEPNGIES